MVIVICCNNSGNIMFILAPTYLLKILVEDLTLILEPHLEIISITDIMYDL